MRLRPLLGAACLSTVAWPHDGTALEIISRAADLAAIERSTKVHALLVVRRNGRDEDAGLEEQLAAAYPDLPDIERDLAGLVAFGVVDMTMHGEQTSVSKQWPVKELPALVVYHEVPQKNPYTGKLYRPAAVADASMLRTPVKLKKMLKAAIPTQFVRELAGPDATWSGVTHLVQEKASAQESVVLAVSKQRQASPMYRAIAAEFQDGGLCFVMLNKDEAGAAEVMRELKVEEAPALVVFRSVEDYVVSRAEGVKTYGALKTFVESFATQKEPERGSSSGGETSNRAARFVRFLSGFDFEQSVVHSDVVWVIEFMAPHREQQVMDEKEWKQALTELHRKAGVVTMGAVSCEKEAALCERHGGPGVRVFPVELTGDGEAKRAEALSQLFATIDAAKEAALATIPDRTVAIASLADLNIFTALAREKHALPVLFFTTKKTAPPMIKALMLSFPTQKIVVAVLCDADESVKKQFLIQASTKTSLVCLVPNQDESKDSASGQFGIISFKKTTMGPYTYPNIMQFLLQVLSQYPHPRDTKPASDEVDVSSMDPASAQSLVPHVTKDNFADLCGGNKICVIGLFEDHVDTAADPESRLATWWTTLAHVAAQSTQRREPFQFMWMNGKCQNDFAEAFGVGLFQMPTLAVYSPSKQRYATKVGLLDSESATAFLSSVLSGGISTAPVGGVPPLGDECPFEEPQGAAGGMGGDVLDDDGDMDDVLREILSDEKQQRDELEKALQSERKPTKSKGKKKKKKKKQQQKAKKKAKKAARDEL